MCVVIINSLNSLAMEMFNTPTQPKPLAKKRDDEEEKKDLQSEFVEIEHGGGDYEPFVLFDEVAEQIKEIRVDDIKEELKYFSQTSVFVIV
jgi:hypothetical protein